jgi:hypothetical protein
MSPGAAVASSIHTWLEGPSRCISVKHSLLVMYSSVPGTNLCEKSRSPPLRALMYKEVFMVAGNCAFCRDKEAENPPFWYSFEYGPIHFAVVSSEHSLRRHSEQWTWLVNHLAAVDRCRTPWLVLGIHRPLYAIYPHHNNRRVRCVSSTELSIATCLLHSRRFLAS